MSSRREQAQLVEFENEAHAAAASGPPQIGDYGKPTATDYAWAIVDSRWLVLSVTLATVALTAIYLFLAAPSYRSDALVQVENESTPAGAALDDISSLLSVKSQADTEIEVIRSRTVLGAAVDQLNLTVVTEPRTFPLVGPAVYRRYMDSGPARPWLGLSSFAWGGERLRISRLEVPSRLLDEPLEFVAEDSGQYRITGPDGEALASGEMGKAVTSGTGVDRFEIVVDDLVARPGTRFRLTKARRARVIDDLQGELVIAEKGKKTGVISISLGGKDADALAATLDAISAAYLRQNVERKSAEAAKTLAFIEEQLPLVRKNLEVAETALNSYQTRHGVVDLSQETQAMLAQAVEIEKGLTEVELARREAQARFTREHPAMLALDSKVAKLRSDRSAIGERMRGVPVKELDSVRLTRDTKVANQLYLLLLNKAQELQLVKSGTIGYARILDAALRPYEPKTKPAVLLAASLLLGLALGTGTAIARKAKNPCVQDPEEIEAGAGLSVYASVPHSDRQGALLRRDKKGSRGILAAENPADLAIESLRSLHASLEMAFLDAPSRVISIGGPSPGAGKSFVAVNLAHVLAGTGKRALLIDADLRRGQLHRSFGVERGPGLFELVAGQCSLTEAVRRSDTATLDFIGTGKLLPNPTDVLRSQRFQELLADVATRYDYVVVDTPPILAVTDAALVARRAGVNLLVVRAGVHGVREIVRSLKQYELAGVTVHGGVLNDVLPRHRGSYAYYDYAGAA
jgi:tyrosine-protein kinase Etk/Wzc